MSIHTARPAGAQSALVGNLALYSIAALAGLAALYTGATYGLDRAGLLGAAIGIASALGCLAGPRLLMVAIKSRDATAALAATAMLAVAIPFAVSGALGNAAAVRDAAVRAETKLTDDRKRLQGDHTRASSALARLAYTRPVAAIESELAAALADPKLQGCVGWLPSITQRTICISKVEPARVELAIAQERNRLEGEMRRASDALSELKAGKPASADAAALSRLAGRLGLAIPPDSVIDGLLVLTVLAVELLGGLALALIRVPVVVTVAESTDGKQTLPTIPLAANLLCAQTEHDRSAAVIERLKQGALVGSQRSIAERLRVPVTTLRNIVESDPRLRLSASREGSRLELLDV